MQIQVIASDANNILCQVTPTPAQTITIDRGVAGNGIVSIVPVTIATFQYLRITYTNGTVSDVGPLTSTAYAATAPINITGNTISLLTVPIASGGTGAITAAAAIENLLPSYTGNGNKRLGLNSGATALEWVADGGGTVTSVDFSGGTTGLTATGGPITTSGTFTLAGTLAIANGGSGATTAQAAINAFAGAVTAGYYLRGDGTNVLMSGIQAADVPTLNQNTTGTAANITATSNSTLITLSSLSLPGSQVSGNISGNAANVTGTVAIANGGTGQTTANAALNALLPAQTGNSGKYLTTDGTNTSWATNPLGTVTSVSGTGTVSGLTLTGTVTTSGSLTLGGTLDLSAYNGAGAFTTLSASGAVTLSGGTANGVAYLNGSKVLTTGSALVFDGSNLGLGVTPTNYGANTTALSVGNGTGSGFIDLYNAGNRRGYHYATASTYNISTTTATALVLETVGVERARINSDGNASFGTGSSYGRVTSDGGAGYGFAAQGGDYALAYKTVNLSAGGIDQFFIRHNLGSVELGTASGRGSLNIFVNGSETTRFDGVGNVAVGFPITSDSGRNITLTGGGNGSAAQAPYFVTNSRALPGSSGTSFPAGGFLFSAYRDVRNPAYQAGITLEAYNASGVQALARALVFRINLDQSGSTFADLGDAALPSEKMRLASNGYLGLGNSSPAAKLDVVGNSFRLLDSIAYNSSVNTDVTWGASNDTSVNNNCTFNWIWNVSGNASGQLLNLFRNRRIDGPIKTIEINNSGDFRLTGDTFYRFTNYTYTAFAKFNYPASGYAAGNDCTEFYVAGAGAADANIQARLRGDTGGLGLRGTLSQSQSFDYAEFFEWVDQNPDNEDRVGYAVVLENNKIRKATDADAPDSIIGVISGTAGVVLNAALFEWQGAHLRDDFGRIIYDKVNKVHWVDADGTAHNYTEGEVPDGVVVPESAEWRTHNEPRVNPDFDPNMHYTDRENRPEWGVVGLMGQVRVRKGQPVGSRWIKMRDVTPAVEEWLIR